MQFLIDAKKLFNILDSTWCDFLYEDQLVYFMIAILFEDIKWN